MDSDKIRATEKRQRRENVLSLLEKIFVGNVVLLFIGIAAYAMLFAAMFLI